MSSKSLLFASLILATTVLVLLLSPLSTSSVSAASGTLEPEVINQKDYLPSEDPEYPHPVQVHSIAVKHHDDDDQVADPDQGSDDGMDEHEAMRCAVCRQAVAPAIIKAVKADAGRVDSKDLIEDTLRKLAGMHVYDMISKTTLLREAPSEASSTEAQRDDNIHNFVEHMLWDEHLSCQLYALAEVWVQQPKRRHWFSRLVDHAICPCHDGKDVLRLDHGLDKYIMNHVAATSQMHKKYQIGHEIFGEPIPDQQKMSAESETTPDDDEISEDPKKRDSATKIATVWVDGDGHLDPDAQREHHQHDHEDMEHQNVESRMGAHDDEGHDATGGDQMGGGDSDL